jgi:predicted CXXCH cytochrome family protein
MGKIKTIAAAALFALVFPAAVLQAGLFDKKKEEVKKDPFAESHAAETLKLKAAPGAHAPVAEEACSKCHASPKDPAKMILPGRELCLSCHKERAGDLAKASVHAPYKEMDCSTCHQPHGSANRALLSAPVNQLCSACHSLADEAIKKSHNGISVIEAECTNCHSPHASANARLITEAVQHVPFQSRSCDMCHDAAGKDGKAALKETPEKTCFVCHSDFKKLAEKPVVHPPFAGGECMACHDPHVMRLPGQLRKPPQELCFACHDAALKNNHPTAGHPTSKKGVMDPRRKDQPFDCVSCHEPHSGLLPKLTREDQMTMCEGCHKQ